MCPLSYLNDFINRAAHVLYCLIVVGHNVDGTLTSLGCGTWMDDTWVTLVDGVAAAGHGVAHLCPLERTLAADHVVFTTAPAHYVPLRARAVIVQMPVI